MSTGQSTTSTGCGTADRADRAADSSGGVETMDVGRIADRALDTHDFSPGNEKARYLGR
ncbi:MAG: hypothetical protein HT580_10530 [Dechloromonas sp.]|nr:MAG: hypothetical protein HT580_10530 [Dechloromonas sp.]